MKPIAHTKCLVCAQTVALRPDGRMKRHPLAPGRRKLCAYSGDLPLCPFCGREATHATVSPDVRVCSDCSGAIGRGEVIAQCDAKGCRGGFTRCDEHLATSRERDEGRCSVCGRRSHESDATPCGECKGLGVLYLAPGAEP